VNRRPAQRQRPPAWLQRAMSWPVRILKILLIGITTCGLGWFWLAFYVYLQWFERQRPRRGRDPQRIR
jgi:hypothetical protein